MWIVWVDLSDPPTIHKSQNTDFQRNDASYNIEYIY